MGSPAIGPEERARLALSHVIDPEVGVNIVDLGLVYSVEIGDTGVRVVMTMTTAACPLGAYLREQARRLVATFLPEAGPVTVDLVWDPPWNPSMMSDEARRILGR
jgi:metal-sulfur cluster biosynthetic enzyme